MKEESATESLSRLLARVADEPHVPLRHLARFISGSKPSTGNAEYWQGGEIPWVKVKDITADRIGDAEEHISGKAVADGVANLVPTGCVLVAVRGTALADRLPVTVNLRPLAISPDIKALECVPELRPGFLSAVLAGQRSSLLTTASTTAHGMRLPDEALRNLAIPLPSVGIQDKISSRLHHLISETDSALAAKARTLRYLAEKQDSLVFSAVTQGVGGRTPMQPARLRWLATVPAHWEIRKVAHLGRIQMGATPPRDRPEYWDGGTLPWLMSTVVNQGEVTSSQEFVTSAAQRDYHLPLLDQGTVLVATAGQGRTRGRSALLSIKATINQNLIAIEPDRELIDPWFLRWSLYAVYGYLRSISDNTGSITGALRIDDIGSLRLPIPPLSEQREIARYIAQEIARLAKVKTLAEHSIGMLRERRAALLAAIAAA